MVDGMVIVGAGQAGARAAETLRTEGYEGPIHLIGSEQHLPYERPHLSKDFLQGQFDRVGLFVHDQQWYLDHNVDLMTGTSAVSLDAGAHSLALNDGSTLRYEALLLTTGSEPRRLNVPGSDLKGVFYLRTIDDADRLREALAAGASNVVVAGGGWIGLEVAAVARTLGHEVTVIDPGEVVLQRVLGADAGNFFAHAHREHGVNLCMGDELASLEGADDRVAAALTTAGRRLAADLVVVGIGAAPRTGLAERAGLMVNNGVVVDASLRSSQGAVFAAGDIANAYHPLFQQHIRVEHWDAARMMSRAAARSMLGQRVAYDRIPYFYTDQYEVSMECTGYVGAEGYEQFLWRGDPQAAKALGFWLRGGCVVAGMSINVPKVMKPMEALVRSGVPVDTAKLGDESVDWEELVPSVE
jgi:3-phenylpropionate/trans-cinnamate dioxygenase ferredoxin reductase subunit